MASCRPSGSGAAVFDHDHFNHAYVAGHLSFKTASDRAGYALGFERPFFGRTKLYLGGELHDLTASDDQWQISGGEASLAAFAARRSYRDYYRRRGVQVSGALRVHPQVELLMAWRGERQEPLDVESDFSLWGGDDPFRPNRFAREGRLNAVVIGASVDGRGFDRESLEATYRRHQLETPFGERLQGPEGKHDDAPIWRIDWTSEISAPDALGSDFDFRRHIVSGRARVSLSPHQDFGARVIGGWSAACCRRSGSSPSAASDRCTATTSRRPSATAWRSSISSTASDGETVRRCSGCSMPDA